MNRRIFLLLVLLTAALPHAGHAQFGGLDKLNRGLDKFKRGVDTAKEAKETADQAAKVVKGVTGLTLEEEKLVGDSVALEIIGAHGGLWRDEDAVDHVNLVGGALARYSKRPELEWRFGILDAESINAFSAPGGYVFITRGLYDQLANDDTLAAVLAHEIAHITEKHAIKIIGRSEATSVLTQEVTKRSSDVREFNAAVAETRGLVADIDPEMARFVDVSASQVVKLILEKGFDPATEYEADREGQKLATLTGFAPNGLRTVLQQLQERGGDSKEIFSTHPSLSNRIRRLPR